MIFIDILLKLTWIAVGLLIIAWLLAGFALDKRRK